jgi:hypothetical protein
VSRQQFALDYIDVATRLVEFREKHPDGSLQQVSIDFREVNGGWWVIYTAAAYRSPDDVRPGIGTAWEPIPGKTNFTRDNEVQNAETAAWGRAMVAALAVDTKRGIASAEEVRNSQERQQARQEPARPSAEAQALADLAPRMPTLDDLKTGVYDPAKEKHLLTAPVADPVTGEVRPLSAVIADAKTRLTQQQTEGAAQ